MDRNSEAVIRKAAGREETAERNPNQRKPVAENPKAADFDDGDNYSVRCNKKASSSQVAVKKRISETTSEKDDGSKEHKGESDESDSDSLGSDLYKNDEDRERLSKLSKLERETILAKRASKISDRNLRSKTKEVIMKDHGQETQPNNSRCRPRASQSQTARQKALDELVKRRRKAAAAAGTDSDRRRSSGKGESSSGSKRVGISSVDEETDYSSSSHHEYDDSMTPAAFEDIRKITVSRSTLENWFREPFFDELIAGCYVRIGIGRLRDNTPVYRLCYVRNVDATNPDRSYRFGNRSTCKFLNVVWGSERSAARWKMVMASDSPPMRQEFDHLAGEIDRNGGNLPSKHVVLGKIKEIEKAKSFVYSAETVKTMLEEKKSSGSKPTNIAAEKARLREQLEKVKEDESEAKRIKARLEALEEAVGVVDLKSTRRLQEMNQKNKVENLTNPIMSKGMQSRDGEPDTDPFSRRWTRSRNYYSTEPLKGETRVAAMEEAEKAGDLEDDGRLVSCTDLYELHNFDLPISLAALQNKLGGATREGFAAGYMARKQWNEARYGAKVPEKTFDGGNQQRGQVLTIEEYKRTALKSKCCVHVMVVILRIRITVYVCVRVTAIYTSRR